MLYYVEQPERWVSQLFTQHTRKCTCPGYTKPPSHSKYDKCSQVQYEVRNGIHGVSYCHTESSEAAWTPVVAKRRKKFPVPHYVHCRFPPDHPIHVQNTHSDLDTDSGSDCDLREMIPSETVSIHYREIDGTPGLSVWTQKSRSWTPVAARTS